jgi:hypothetical protein
LETLDLSFAVLGPKGSERGARERKKKRREEEGLMDVIRCDTYELNRLHHLIPRTEKLLHTSTSSLPFPIEKVVNMFTGKITPLHPHT